MFRTICVVVAVMGMATFTLAGPITVDGAATDWGITLTNSATGALNAYGGGAGVTADGFLGIDVQDVNDFAGHSTYIGPNFGGQDYNAELLAVAMNGSTVSLLLITGQRPDNGERNYSPGDIRIETSAGRFGIEVGGGLYGGGDAGGLIETKSDGTLIALGTTYLLNGSGYTDSHFNHATPAAGSIWQGGGWILDPINPKGPTQLNPGALGLQVGLSDYVYTRNDLSGPQNTHAIIELSFDIGVLGGADLQSVHWRPSCGNDEVNLAVSLTPVPEPSSLALAALGVAGLALLRRRKR